VPPSECSRLRRDQRVNEWLDDLALLVGREDALGVKRCGTRRLYVIAVECKLDKLARAFVLYLSANVRTNFSLTQEAQMTTIQGAPLDTDKLEQFVFRAAFTDEDGLGRLRDILSC
jgi:hypothetical protein